MLANGLTNIKSRSSALVSLTIDSNSTDRWLISATHNTFYYRYSVVFVYCRWRVIDLWCRFTEDADARVLIFAKFQLRFFHYLNNPIEDPYIYTSFINCLCCNSDTSPQQLTSSGIFAGPGLKLTTELRFGGKLTEPTSYRPNILCFCSSKLADEWPLSMVANLPIDYWYWYTNDYENL